MAELLSALIDHNAVSGPMSVDHILNDLQSGAPPARAFGIPSGAALPTELWARLQQVAGRCRPPEPRAPEVLADYRIAAQRLERDLAATLGWKPAIELTINGAGGYVSLPGRGFSLGWGKSLPGRIVRMSDELQGEVGLSRRVAWPQCPVPGHDHPLHAVERAGLAVWQCQLNGRVVAEIGSLSGVGESAKK